MTDGPHDLRSPMEGHLLNPASVGLLAAVTGVPEPLLLAVRVFHRRNNWLNAPWYAASRGGGGLTLGDRIYVTPEHDPALLDTDPERWWRWLLLMAHEVGHVRQAHHFGFDAWGRTRFALWASGKYVGSFLRNGSYAHDRAPFEVEAEGGRRALALLMELTGGCNAAHPVVGMAMRNDHAGMNQWLREQAAAVRRARSLIVQ